MSILLLFPYHTFMIWNNFGQKFYIWNGNNNFLSSLIIFFSPWLMPILFLIAGISSRYSLEKRNTKEFIKERTKKLLIPLLSGLILLVPFQTLYARKHFFNYNGGILSNYKYFFTHISDLNGYDGMFTLGHLWFLLYLFIISLISLLIVKKISSNKINTIIDKLNIFTIILVFISLFISNFIGNFGGQSIGKYLILYLLGYYLFTDKFIEKLLNYKKSILITYTFSQLLLVILYFKYNYYGDLLVAFVSWLGILSFIIIGNLFLNRENKLTLKFKKSSFSIYILHQTTLIIIAYYTLKIFDNIIVQIIYIILTSFITTLILNKIISKVPILNKLLSANQTKNHT